MRKPHPENKPAVPPFLVACIIVVAVAILVATVSDPDTQSPSDWVIRYQSLIGGLAAMIAAYITVAQMRATDELAEKRHHELFGVSIRADYLRLHRAFGLHKQSYDEIAGLTLPLHDVASADNVESERTLQLLILFERVENAVRAYNRNFLHSMPDDISELFDAHLTRLKAQAEDTTVLFVKGCGYMTDAIPYFRPGRDYDDAYSKTRRDAALKELRTSEIYPVFDAFKVSTFEYHRALEQLLIAYGRGGLGQA